MIIFKKISFIILLTIICILRTEAGIKDAIFATVGDKAITHSDITNEIKINLVLSNISFSEENTYFVRRQINIWRSQNDSQRGSEASK